MIELILDGCKKEIKDGADLVRAINNYLEDSALNDRFLNSCLVNGSYVSELEEVVKLNEDRIERVEITTSSRGELVRETIGSVKNYLAKLSVAVEEFAEIVGTGQGNALTIMPGIIEGLEWFCSACNALYQHRDLLASDAAELKEIIERVNETLRLVVQAWEAQDLISVADILEYELTAVLSETGSVLDRCTKVGEEIN